jgi:hypothetical protein
LDDLSSEKTPLKTGQNVKYSKIKVFFPNFKQENHCFSFYGVINDLIMKNLMWFFIFLFVIFFNSGLSGQKYDFAGGLRWGGNFGFTLSERIINNITLEQNLNAEDEKFNYSVLLMARHHKRLLTNRFNWFYGGGAGLLNLKEKNNFPSKNTLALGLQTGLEFTVGRVSISGTLEPLFYSDRSDFRFNMNEVISAKYVIIKRKSEWKENLKDRFSKKKKSKKSDPWWKFKKKK